MISVVSAATSAAAARDKADSFNICLSEYAVKESKSIRGELVDYCECLKAVEDRKQHTIETVTVSVLCIDSSLTFYIATSISTSSRNLKFFLSLSSSSLLVAGFCTLSRL